MNSYLRKRNDFDVFDEDFLHDVFGVSRNKNLYNIMKTDIMENDKEFQLNIDMPGYDKNEIKVQLEKGYLTIEGVKNESKDEQPKENENNQNKENRSRFIRRERYYGSVSRSYYVGDDVKQENIKATFKNGVLTLIIPKVDKSKVEEKKFIEIE